MPRSPLHIFLVSMILIHLFGQNYGDEDLQMKYKELKKPWGLRPRVFCYSANKLMFFHENDAGEVEMTYEECPPQRKWCNPDLMKCTEIRFRGSFVCPEGGNVTYPTEGGCDAYYLCERKHHTPKLILCDVGENYKHKEKKCVKGAPCVNFDCNGKSREEIRYPDDDRILALCSSVGPVKIKHPSANKRRRGPTWKIPPGTELHHF